MIELSTSNAAETLALGQWIGERLPVHKEPPRAGGDYPLRMTGGHTRWSIHATWRDSALMLRLQRGEPALWVSSLDASARGIRDGDIPSRCHLARRRDDG